MHITRRQLFGFMATALLAGCAQPDAPAPPLPMGPPLEKEASSTEGATVNLGDTPPHFQVKFETSKGDFIVEVHSHWSPNGAAHFYELVKNGFYDECRFFRVMPEFMVQWGINGDPKVNAKWHNANIPDDHPTGENKKSNQRGYITYAKTGAPNSRSTQLFINYVDNRRLDSDGFTPFGRVVEGMSVLEKINFKYREQPAQPLIEKRGNEYLNKEFPDLDYIKKATLIDAHAAPSESTESAEESK